MPFLTIVAALSFSNTAIIPVPVEIDWWKNRHEAMVKRIAERETDVIFVGDSITHCFGGEPYTPEPFCNRGKDTWDLYYGDRKAVNLGISGDRTEHVLWRLERTDLTKAHPKVAVVMIGTNNVHFNTAPEIVEGVEAVVNKIHAKTPKTKVLLLAVFPRSEPGSEYRLKLTAVNQSLAAWCKGGNATFLDINSAFLNAKGEIPDSIMPDKLHPFAFGYRKWAMAMEPTLAKLLGQRPKSKTNAMNTAVVPVTHNRDYPMYDWEPRHRYVLEWSKARQIDTVFIGDSITHRWGADPCDPSDKTPKTGLAVWNKAFAKFRPVNFGFGFDKTENVIWRIEQGELDGISPKAFVVLIGTNNLGDNTVHEIRDGISTILDLIQQKHPKAKTLLLGTLPRGEKKDDSMRVKANELNALLAKMRKKNVTYLDLGKSLLQPDGSITPDTMPDFVHPTESAYQIIADQIQPILAKWLKV